MYNFPPPINAGEIVHYDGAASGGTTFVSQMPSPTITYDYQVPITNRIEEVTNSLSEMQQGVANNMNPAISNTEEVTDGKLDSNKENTQAFVEQTPSNLPPSSVVITETDDLPENEGVEPTETSRKKHLVTTDSDNQICVSEPFTKGNDDHSNSIKIKTSRKKYSIESISEGKEDSQPETFDADNDELDKVKEKSEQNQKLSPIAEEVKTGSEDVQMGSGGWIK